MAPFVPRGGTLQIFRMKLVQAFLYEGTAPLVIRTAEKDMMASPGDWILIDLRGKLYPYKADIFAAAFEAISD